jgi:hypothetical protein
MRHVPSILLFFLLAIPAVAQDSAGAAPAAQNAPEAGRPGTLTGTVTDPKGAVVVGASVTARNAAGTSFNTTTDGGGKFVFPALVGGPQLVIVTQSGFAENRTEGVNVEPGQTLDIAITLQLESNESTVEVTADQVEHIETDNGVLSNTLSRKEIESFPVNGRNVIAFTALAPGVSNQTGQDEIKVGVLGSAKFAVNGGRTEYNSFQVDGNDVLNTDIGASHGHSTLMVYPSMDAVREVKVLTSNYGAEYGRSASGTTLFNLRSGQAKIHGSAYEYIRNEFFNARNYFDQTNKSPLYRRNDFGGSIGGPLFIPHIFNSKMDHTFVFISEEFRKERSPQQFNQGVPSDAERGYNALTSNYGAYGDFSDVCPAAGASTVNIGKYPDCPTQNIITPFPNNLVPISPTAAAFLQTGLIPRANATSGCISSDSSCYVATVSPATDYREDLGRLDQTLPLKSQLSFSAVHDHWATVVPIPQWTNYINSFPTVENNFLGPGLSAIAHVTTLLSAKTLNDFSYGINLQRIALSNIPGPGADLSRSTIDGVPLGTIFSNNGDKLPSLIFSGNDPAYGSTGFNIDTSFDPWHHTLYTQSIRDSVSQMWNKHTLLAGIQTVHAHRTEESAVNGGNTGDVQGTLIFNNQLTVATRNSFADFLTGGNGVQSYQQDNDQFTYQVHYWTIEPYVQDDWKITSRLTLNLGFRMSLYYNWEPENIHLFNWNEKAFNNSLLADNGVTIFPLQGFLQYGNNQQDNNFTPVPLNQAAYQLLYNGLVECGTSTVPNSCQSRHLMNPAPRLGFAWSPTADGHYSVRGGYGVFFEHGTGSEANAGSLVSNPPYVLSMQQSNPGGYAQIGDPSGQVLTGSYLPPAFPLNLTSIPSKTVWPYVQQWSFGVEAQLPSDAFVSVSYVGSKGTHLAEEWQANQLAPVTDANNPFPPGTPIDTNGTCLFTTPPSVADASSFVPINGTPLYYSQNPTAYTALYAACNGSPAPYNASGTPSGQPISFDANSLRPWQGVGRVQNIDNVASSIYHSLQLTMRRNHGPLDLVASYTYSHAIDSASDRFESNFVNKYDLAANRASSDFDQRHMVNLTYVYQLPLLKFEHNFYSAINCTDTMDQGDTNCPAGSRKHYAGPSGLMRLALNNWSLAGITLVQTGTPFSVVNNRATLGSYLTSNGITGVDYVSSPDNAGLLIGNAADSYPDKAANGIACEAEPRNLIVAGTFGPLLRNPCSFQAPRGLTQGNSGRNFVRNPTRTNFDVALLRNFKAWNEKNFEFRADVFNVFNHTQFILFDPSKGNTAANSVACYGDITTGYSAGAQGCEAANGLFRPIEAHRPRTMQFGLRMEF